MDKIPVTGALAANAREGSRSEVLADYLLSGWGSVTPVRRQDDYGVDLYCTLTERVGRRALVREYYVVQVKSTQDPWVFEQGDAVRWLTNHPLPIFLACVNKGEGILSVYHVMPRFLVSALGLSNRITLIPEDKDEGIFVEWKDAAEFSLSAPIIRVRLVDFTNKETLDKLRDVFAYWVRIDRNNCDLVRRGLLRFRMPTAYRANELPTSFGEMGNAIPSFSQLQPGILAAAEAVECIGGQLLKLGDRTAVLNAALLVDHLQNTYKDFFANEPRWNTRIPADLGSICDTLNKLMPDGGGSKYRYSGLDSLEEAIRNIPLVTSFLEEK